MLIYILFILENLLYPESTTEIKGRTKILINSIIYKKQELMRSIQSLFMNQRHPRNRSKNQGIKNILLLFLVCVIKNCYLKLVSTLHVKKIELTKLCYLWAAKSKNNIESFRLVKFYEFRLWSEIHFYEEHSMWSFKDLSILFRRVSNLMAPLLTGYAWLHIFDT